MITDIVLLILCLISMFFGFRKGFAVAVLSVVGWVAAPACGILFNSVVLSFIQKNTGFVEIITEHLEGETAEYIGLIIMRILIFILIFLVIKLIFSIICRIISNNREGFAGFTDGLLGMLLGAVRGLVIATILLCVLLPLLKECAPELAAPILTDMKGSYVSQYIYDYNPLLTFLKGTLLNAIN